MTVGLNSTFVAEYVMTVGLNSTFVTERHRLEQLSDICGDAPLNIAILSILTRSGKRCYGTCR